MSTESHLRNSLIKHGTKTAAKPTPATKGIRSMEIEHGAAGGFIVTHHMPFGENNAGSLSGMSSGSSEPKRFPLRNSAELKKHVAEHMCGGCDAESKSGKVGGK